MPVPTPEAAAENWANGLSRNVQKYLAGVERVQASPAIAAIAVQQRMVERWNESISNGKWRDNLGAVTLLDWKQAVRETGGARLTQAIPRARRKVELFMQRFLPYVERSREEVRRMPNVTLEDKIARMERWTRLMAAFRGVRRQAAP
jgi:hypothetical protein